jgi:hypothetical protein
MVDLPGNSFDLKEPFSDFTLVSPHFEKTQHLFAEKNTPVNYLKIPTESTSTAVNCFGNQNIPCYHKLS